MDKKVMKKNRRGQWVIVSLLLLLLGGGVATGVKLTQESNSSHHGAKIAKTSQSDTKELADSSKTKDHEETKGNKKSSHYNPQNTLTSSEEVSKNRVATDSNGVKSEVGTASGATFLTESSQVVLGQTKQASSVDSSINPSENKQTTKDVKGETEKVDSSASEVKSGGEVKLGETKVVSDETKPETSSSTVAPADTPQGTGSTTTNVTPGAETVTKPEVPAQPATPEQPEVKDEDGNVVTPAVSGIPEVPGTPAETTRTDVQTETTEITFGTKYVKDTSLAPGEQKVITQGVNGQRVVTTNITYTNGVETGREVLSDVTTPAVDQVIAYNDEPAQNREVIEETTNETTYATERRASTDLKPGEERVVTKGVNGVSKTKTKKVYDANGTLISTEDLGIETISEPVNEVIEYGVEPEHKETVEEERTTETLPFETETRENANLPKGETRIVQEGMNGSVDYVTNITKIDGVEIGRETRDENRVEPVNQIVEVGTKEVDQPKDDSQDDTNKPVVTEETVEEIVPFETETRENSNLKKGETRVIQEGQNGYKRYKVTTTTIQENSSITRELIDSKEAVNKIVEIGTHEDIRTEMRVERQEIDYETETRSNPELFQGEIHVAQEGKKGSKSVTFKDTYVNGELVASESVGDPVIIPAVPQIIDIGTREPFTTTSIVNTEVINFKSISQDDLDLEQGQTRIIQNGINGERKVEVTRTTNNRTGETREESKVLSETPAIDEIVAIGTKVKPAGRSITVQEFARMSEAEQDAFMANTENRINNDSVQSEGAGQEEVEASINLINMDRLNDEFVKLMNADRSAKGLAPVTYAGRDSVVQYAATTRATEMARYGSLRYEDKPEGAHKRPDGSAGNTVYGDAAKNFRWKGENSLQYGTALTADKTYDEAKLAESMYQMWKDSSSHFKIMMKDAPNLQVAVGIGSGAHTYNLHGREAGLTVGMLELVRPN